MQKKVFGLLVSLIILTIVGAIFIGNRDYKNDLETNNITATVMAVDDSLLTIQDSRNIIYTFNWDNAGVKVGDNVLIEYTGLLDKNTQLQKIIVLDYNTSPVSKNENGIPNDWMDKGIFSNYYVLANNKLKTLSLYEKIGQLFLVRYPNSNALDILKKYNLGGYVFFEKDFRGKSKLEVKNMIKELQNSANIPILTAVDEEGGKVVRVSSNSNLRNEKFKSSSELYGLGGFNLIKQDTIEKSQFLNELGLNLNLAPVVDVSTNSNDYMYDRTLGQNTDLTSTYAKTVINASKGTMVSYTLKHFPGYGNNADTHTGSSIDNRTYEDITQNDLPPFRAGIDAGAEAVLISHNIVSSIDAVSPASLSPSIHNLLRNNMNFTGIVITDDLDMDAVSSINDSVVKAILAGNDLIIVTDYENSINSVKKAINNGIISEKLIDKLAFRVLAWKYYKGLMFENQK